MCADASPRIARARGARWMRPPFARDLRPRRQVTGGWRVGEGPALALRRTPPGGSGPPGHAHDPDEDTLVEDEPTIRCAACGHAVTRPEHRTSVEGRHARTFKNPAGLDYEVACFREAAGCRGVGERSGVWTWFPGFDWRVEVCGGCAEHLGWSFARPPSRAPSFYALILARLREG